MAVIGRPLSERYTLAELAPEQAVASLETWLSSHGALVVDVRAKGPHMVACLVARADQASVRLCQSMGLSIQRGGTVVFGVAGADLAGMLPRLGSEARAWLTAPCEARETKVVLVAGGLGLLSIVTADGRATIRAITPGDA